MVDNDMTGLTGGLGSYDAFGRDNLSSERSLVFVNIDRDSGLIIVRLGLKEVLLSSNSSAAMLKKERRSSVRRHVRWTTIDATKRREDHDDGCAQKASNQDRGSGPIVNIQDRSTI